MNKTLRGLVAAGLILCAVPLAAPAYADNYVVKDGNGSLLTMAAKLVGSVLHPFHVAEGLNSSTGAPQAATIDNATGGVNVNVVGGSSGGGVGTLANASPTSVTEGSTTTPLSLDLNRNLRVVFSNASIGATQSGAWNITNISGTVSLPTGAATAANQAAVQSAPGTPQTTSVTIQGNSSGIPVPVSGSFSASGFAPNGNFGTLTATAASSASTALPSGAVVAFQNTSSVDVSCVLSTGAATATTNKIIVRGGATVFVTVGSNVNTACINQTGSASNVVVLAGGSGLGAGFGGGGSAGGGGAVTVADGADVTLGAKADSAAASDTATASLIALQKRLLQGITTLNGAVATTANQTSVIGTKAAGTAASNSLLIGGVYNTSLPTLTTGQQAAAQFDSSGRLIVNVGAGGAGGGAVYGPTAAGSAAANPPVLAGGTADGTATGTIKNATVKAASTAPATTDTTLVVGIANGNNVVEGTQTDTTCGATHTLSGCLYAAANNTGVVKGAGTAGAPDSAPVTVQGISGGTALNTSDAATSATGSAVPSKATFVGANSGGNLTGLIQADSSAAINVSTATTTQLVALSAGKKIYVTSYDVVAGGTGNITFEYGTGTNCGTGTTVLTGAYNLTAQAGIAKGNGLGAVLVVPAGNALCVLTSAAVQMSGSVAYTQF